MEEDKLKEAQEQFQSLSSLSHNQLFNDVPAAGSSLSPGAVPIKTYRTNQEVGTTGESITYQAPEVTDTEARIGDYVMQGGVGVVVPDSPTDIARRYVTSDAKTLEEIANLDLLNMSTEAIGKGVVIPSALTGLGVATGPAGLAVTGVMAGAFFLDDYVKKMNAARDAYNAQDFNYELAGDIVTNDKGEVAFRPDYKKMAGAGPESGKSAIAASDTTDTKVEMSEDNKLNITVSPVFAESNEYKNIAKLIKDNYETLTKEEANKVFDEDTGATLLNVIDSLVKKAESQHLFNLQAVSLMKETAPAASDNSLNIGADIMQTAYFTEKMLSDATIKIYDEKNKLVEINAKKYYDDFRDMDKLKRQDYIVSLGNRINSADISDDEKAILYAQSRALYAASDQDGAYKGMLSKDFFDDIGMLWGGDVALSAFKDDSLHSGLMRIGSSVGRVMALGKITGKIEDTFRKITPKLASAIGGGGIGSAIESVKSMDDSLDKLAVTAIEAGKMAGQVGYQLAADAVFDLAEMVPYALANNLENYDYWEMLGTDFWMDTLMTFGPRTVVDAAHAPKYEYRVAVENTKTGDIEYKRLKDLKSDDNFRVIYDEYGMRDAQLVEVTAEELQMRRAKTISQLSNTKIGLKVQEMFADKNAAMAKVAVDALAKGDVYNFRRVLRVSNDIKQLEADVRAEFLSDKNVQTKWDDFKTSYKEVSSPVKHKLSKEDVNYINAAANEYRFLKRAEGDTEAEEKIRDFYKDAKNGVTSERAAELEGLMTKLRAVADTVLDFYQKKGIMTKEEVKELRNKPEYQGQMYMPVFTKTGIKQGGDVKQDRALLKQIRNGSALIAVKDFQHPLEALSSYIDNAMRAVAVNERALVLREAAAVAKTGVHLVSDTSGIMTDTKTLRQLDKKFKQGTDKIAAEVKKELPSQKQWQETNNKIVLESEAYKNADKLQSLQDESVELKKELRNVRNRKTLSPEEKVVKIADIQARIQENKQQQLRTTDEIKDQLKVTMEKAQEAHKGSNFKLDIQSYLDVQATNSLKKAIQSSNMVGNVQKVINDAVEYSNPWVDPKDVINSRWESYIKEYRNEVAKELKEQGQEPGEQFNLLVDKVMDKLTQKLTGEKPTEVTFIDEEGMPTILLDNYGQKDTIRYKINGEIQEMKLAGKGAEELVAEFYRPEYNAPKTTLGKIGHKLTQVGNKLAQAKRYLTTSGDISRMMPNLARDWSRGIVTTGGEILLSPEKLLDEIISVYGYDAATISKIQDGLMLARESVDESTLNASLRMPKKNRAKSMVKAMTEPDGNAFIRFTYDASHGRVGELLARPQDFSETLTRKRAMDTAYYRELSDSQAKGYTVDVSIKRAVEAAYFAGRESTVNFARRGTVIEKVAQMVPYLSQRFASIESFKYAYLDDPIAVTRALESTTSMYVGMIALALSNEESRKRYYLLSEYDRSNNILIPIDNGTILTIPLDENLAAFLTPYRRMVETLNGVDPESFFLCFADGLSALSPIDLSGFSEGDKFNIQRGFEKLGSEFVPLWAQPIIETATGRSLYYGSNLKIDSDYTGTFYDNWTPTNGELTTRSKNSQTLAEISDNVGIPQWILQNFLSQYGGNIGQYVLNTIDKMKGATEEAQGGKEWADSIFKPFTGVDSDQASSAFYDAINELKNVKKQTQKEIATITQKIAGTSGEEKAELIKQRQKKISDYGIQVTDVLNQYLSAYEITGGLSKQQANQAWYLYMLYESDNLQDDMRIPDSTGDYYTDKASAYNKKQATNLAAISGLDALVQSPVDAYNDSYAESAFKNTVYGDTTKYIAKIERVLKDNEISRYNMYQDYYGKVSSSSSSADKKKAKASWNAKVVTLLEPYVNEVGIDNLLSQRKVVDYLDEVLFIDNPYKTKEYLKTIFGGD